MNDASKVVKNEKARLAVVIVMFDRCSDFSRTLEAFESLSDDLDSLIILDSASTDSTRSVNEKAKDTFNDRLVTIHLESYTGGAGGFPEGVRKTLDLNVDRIWLGGNDAILRPNCLRQILDSANSLNDVYRSVAIEADSPIKSPCWPAPLLHQGKKRSHGLIWELV